MNNENQECREFCPRFRHFNALAGLGEAERQLADAVSLDYGPVIMSPEEIDLHYRAAEELIEQGTSMAKILLENCTGQPVKQGDAYVCVSSAENKNNMSEREIDIINARHEVGAQLPNAFDGYSTFVDAINDIRGFNRRGGEEVTKLEEEQLVEQLKEWLTDEKLAYVVDTKRKSREYVYTESKRLDYNLVIVPDVTLTYDGLRGLVADFAHRNNTEFVAVDSVWRRIPEQRIARVNKEEPKSGVSFLLVPNSSESLVELTWDSKIDSSKFDKLNREFPFIKLPTVLDAVANWYALASQGKLKPLEPGHIYSGNDLTKIAHMEFMDRRTGLVPVSGVDTENGIPYLHMELLKQGRRPSNTRPVIT